MSTGKQPNVLISGFEPFGGESLNPSWLVAERFAQREINGFRIHAVLLPTAFGKAERKLLGAMRKRSPHLVLMLGEAGNRSRISLERIAINVMDARIPDNAGRQPKDRSLDPNGPAGFLSTLPLVRLRDALLAADIPAEISNTAGTFVCNAVMYRTLQFAADMPRPAQAGFIHLPYLPEQAVHHRHAPSMALSDQIAALEICLRTLL